MSGFFSGTFGGFSSSNGRGGGDDSYNLLKEAALPVVDSGLGLWIVASPTGFINVQKKHIPLKIIQKVQDCQSGMIYLVSKSSIEERH